MAKKKILSEYDLNGNRIYNFGAPISQSDAISKDFVDEKLIDNLLISNHTFESQIITPPSSFSFRLNDLVVLNATEIYISVSDINTFDITPILKNLNENDVLKIQQTSNSYLYSYFKVVSIVDNTTYYTINVIYMNSSIDGSPVSTNDCTIEFIKQFTPEAAPETQVFFDQDTPTTIGVVFDPDVQSTIDVLYISSTNSSTWIWNGSAYVQVKAQGEITTVTLNAAGTGYSANDIVTIVQAGGSLGTVKVDTIGGGGAVATFSIITPGSGYAVANGLSTTVVPSGGTGFKLNITAIGSLTSATGTFEEFSTGTTKYTIFSNATNRYAWNGTAVTSLSNAPLSKIFTTHKGRIYWARDNDIVYSALNLINDYSTPNDAGTIDITQIKGGLVSLYAYSDRVWAFGEYSMHGLYGTGPANFELINIEGSVGSISDKGIAVANKKLYWVNYDGIYEFDGSVPYKISEPYSGNGVDGGVTTFVQGIKLSLRSLIVSGSLGDYLYISIPYGSSATTNNLTLVFDTKLRQWYIRDEGFLEFVTVGVVAIGVCTTGGRGDGVV